MKELWPRSVRVLLLVLFFLAGLTLILEAWLVDDPTTIPGFYTGAGFLSCVVLIVITALVGKVIRRRDDYYDD